MAALGALRAAVEPFRKSLPAASARPGGAAELDGELPAFAADLDAFRRDLADQRQAWSPMPDTNRALRRGIESLAPLAETSRHLAKQADQLCKLACRVVGTFERECASRDSKLWNTREINRARKAADEARQIAVEQLRQVRYYWKQAHWLMDHFPDAVLRDVPGLVKLVDRAEIAANDWSLTPGRYVGVAPEEEDEDFDFGEAMRAIHTELADLDAQAAQLAATIQRNFEGLGI